MPKEYNIAKAAGRCAACGGPLAPGAEFVAAVREAGEELLREDFCPGCWEGRAAAGAGELLGHWRSRVPQPQEKKKRFVDEEVILSFFHRLEDADQPASLQFRFVLALALMRKKMLIYDRREKRDDGQELWTLHWRGTDQPCQLINPHMDEAAVEQVGQRLAQVMEGEL